MGNETSRPARSGYVHFRHPGYPDDSNIILRLPSLDGPHRDGVHHETARIACAVIANNRWDGHLSTSKNGVALDETSDDILTGENYYFFTPEAVESLSHADSVRRELRYPIVRSFLHWKFPKDDLPEYWIAATPLEQYSEATRQDWLANTLFTLRAPCQLTGTSPQTQRTRRLFFTTLEEDDWFVRNGLTKQNSLCLRDDIWQYNSTGAFAFVPKMHSDDTIGFVMQVLFKKWASVDKWHNQRLETMGAVGVEMLFAFFGHSVLRHSSSQINEASARDQYIYVLDEVDPPFPRTAQTVRWYEYDPELQAIKDLFFALSRQSTSQAVLDAIFAIAIHPSANEQQRIDLWSEWSNTKVILQSADDDTFFKLKPQLWETVSQMLEINYRLMGRPQLVTEELFAKMKEQRSQSSGAQPGEIGDSPRQPNIGISTEETANVKHIPQAVSLDSGITSSLQGTIGGDNPSKQTGNGSRDVSETVQNDATNTQAHLPGPASITPSTTPVASRQAIAEQFVRSFAKAFSPTDPSVREAWQRQVEHPGFIESLGKPEPPETTGKDKFQERLQEIILPRADRDLVKFLRPAEDSGAPGLTYHPLPSPRSIRVLKLHAGKPSDDIVCELEVISLDESARSEFEALSYVWGDATHRSPITVDGASFQATRNLKSALRHLRRPWNDARILWVDAVCINQNDLSERGQQVQMMRDIYAHAKQVLVWLGEAGDEGDLMLKVCERLEPHFDKNLSEEVLSFSRARYMRKLDSGGRASVKILDKAAIQGWSGADLVGVNGEYVLEGDQEQLLEEEIPDGDRPTTAEWQALCRLLRRPWFQRMWIVQEVTVPEKALVYAGTIPVRWNELLFAYFSCHQMHTVYTQLETYRPLLNLQALRESVHGTTTKRELLTLLQRFRGFQATDPRDKIYALLGVTTSDLNAMGLVPNYRASVQSCFQDVTLAIIRSSQSFDIFSVSFRSGTRMSNLPSWVPDWSDPGPHPKCITAWSNLDRRFPQLHHHEFSASGKSVFLEPAIRDSTIVCLTGHSVDRIASIGDRLSGNALLSVAEGMAAIQNSPNDMVGMVENMLSMISAARDAIAEVVAWHFLADITSAGEEPYPPYHEHTRKEAFARTLCLDHPVHGLDKLRAAVDAWCVTIAGKEMQTFMAGVGEKDTPPTVTDMASMVKTVQALVACIPGLRPFLALTESSYYRRFAVMESGMYAIVPSCAQVGDEILVLQGAQVPFVMRPNERSQNSWEMMGDTYVHGIMDGEAYNETKCGRVDVV